MYLSSLLNRIDCISSSAHIYSWRSLEKDIITVTLTLIPTLTQHINILVYSNLYHFCVLEENSRTVRVIFVGYFSSSVTKTEVLCAPSSTQLEFELMTPDHDSTFHVLEKFNTRPSTICQI